MRSIIFDLPNKRSTHCIPTGAKLNISFPIRIHIKAFREREEKKMKIELV